MSSEEQQDEEKEEELEYEAAAPLEGRVEALERRVIELEQEVTRLMADFSSLRRAAVHTFGALISTHRDNTPEFEKAIEKFNKALDEIFERSAPRSTDEPI